MSNFFVSIIYGLTIGVALSVDAFLLSLIYGSTFRRKRESFLTSVIVGLFHLVMPLIGYFLASYVFRQINLTNYLKDKVQFITFIILSILGIMMLLKKENKGKINLRNLMNKSLFAFSVSIDAFLTGIAFTTLNHINIFVVSILFAFVSCCLTFIAVSIGKKTAEKLLNANLDYYAGLLIITLAVISLFI